MQVITYNSGWVTAYGRGTGLRVRCLYSVKVLIVNLKISTSCKNVTRCLAKFYGIMHYSCRHLSIILQELFSPERFLQELLYLQRFLHQSLKSFKNLWTSWRFSKIFILTTSNMFKIFKFRFIELFLPIS